MQATVLTPGQALARLAVEFGIDPAFLPPPYANIKDPSLPTEFPEVIKKYSLEDAFRVPESEIPQRQQLVSKLSEICTFYVSKSDGGNPFYRPYAVWFFEVCRALELGKYYDAGTNRLVIPTDDESKKRFLANIPPSYDPTLIRLLRAFASSKYKPNKAADIVHVLEHLDLFCSERLLRSFILQKDQRGAWFQEEVLARRLPEFLGSSTYMVCFLVAMGIFPLTVNLNNYQTIASLRKYVLFAVGGILKEAWARTDDIRKAVVRSAYRCMQGITPLDETSPDFFLMKTYQTLQTRDRDATNSFYVREESDGKKLVQQCPLFKEYTAEKVMGSGVFGVVLKFQRRGIPYAVKIQDGMDDSSAYTELRIMYEIQRATRHWSSKRIHKGSASPFNHVYLFDWVRCEFNPKERFKALLEAKAEDSLPDFVKANIPRVLQIIVEEFASEGNLLSVMTKHLEGTAPIMMNPNLIKEQGFHSLLIQIFGHLHILGRRFALSHKDMKPENVLVQPLAKEFANKIKYLVYQYPPGGPLYVPLEHSEGRIYKVSDYGRGRMQISGERAVTLGSSSAVYNPAHDLEWFLVMFFGGLMTYSRVAIHMSDKSIFSTFLQCLHPGRTLFEDIALLTDHKNVPARLQFFFKDGLKEEAFSVGVALAKSLAGHYDNIIQTIDSLMAPKGRVKTTFGKRKTVEAFKESCFALYGQDTTRWENHPTAEDLTTWDRLFRLPQFDPYRTKPEDLSEENSIVMDDYEPSS